MAREAVDRFQVIDHHANDSTGFSATLLKDIDPTSQFYGTYTLSLRSTEFRKADEGGDRSRDVFGADMEIVRSGFAFGQITAMEEYYKYLRTSGILPKNAVLNVTGYSLGGHLATIFTELHADEVQHTYTFNSPGRGGFDDIQHVEELEASRIRAMIDRLEQIMLNPMTGWQGQPNPNDLDFFQLYQAASRAYVLAPDWRPYQQNSSENIYDDPRYRWAKAVVVREFQPDSRVDEDLVFDQARSDGAFAKITQIVGRASHSDTEYVANSQYHPPSSTVFIEDQPTIDGGGGIFGDSGDFGTTHSITLILDSLVLQQLFLSIDPALARTQVESIFAASSAQHAFGFIAAHGVSEGDSLESALDALFKALTCDDSKTPYSRETGGFGNLENRSKFYERMDQLKSAAASLPNPIHIVPIFEQTPDELSWNAMGLDKLAYRYALKELNPFIVLGPDYQSLHNSHGELDLYDADHESGSLSREWLEDRTKLLVALDKGRIDDSEKEPGRIQTETGRIVYSYIGGDDQKVVVATSNTLSFTKSQIDFGGDRNDLLVGHMTDDHLYGEAGNDTINGAAGRDWIEGGDGNDVLDGGEGGDWLLGGRGDDHLTGGRGANVLEGGPGVDTYIQNSADKGFDFIRDNDGTIVFDGITVTGGWHIIGNIYASEDLRFEFRLDGSTLYINGSVALLDFQNGDLGITLNGAPLLDNAEANTTSTGLSNKFSEAYWGTGADDIVQTRASGRFAFATGAAGQDVVVLGAQGSASGGAGADYVVGSNGNDLLYGDFSGESPYKGMTYGLRYFLLDADQVEILIPSGWSEGGASGSILFDSIGVFTNKAAAEYLNGTSFDADLSTFWNDVIEGGAGDDVIDGGAGSDQLYGGEGNDRIDDGLVIQVNAPYQSVEGFVYGMYAKGTNDDYLDGGPGDDELVSHAGRDWQVGGEGNDTLFNGAVMEGGPGNDTLFGAQGAGLTPVSDPWMFGGEGDDWIYANSSANIDGGIGRDVILVNMFSLQGGTAVDITDSDGAAWLALNTGDGIPPTGYSYLSLFTFARNDGDLVVLFHNDGVPVVDWKGWFSTPDSGASNISVGGIFGGPFSLILTKSEIDAMVVQFLDGTEAGDAFVGGAESVAVRGNEGNDSLKGGSGDDFLSGGAGNDTLEGGAGINVLMGGAGDDIYLVRNSTTSIAEDRNGGLDTAYSSVSFALPINVENLTLCSSESIDGTGNGGANVLTGNDAANVLDGKGGADTLIGGAGGDTYIYGLGYGNDFVSDGGAAGEVDRVQFTGGLSSMDVKLAAEGDNLVVTLIESNEKLTIAGMSSPDTRIESLVFSDRTIEAAELAALFSPNSPPILARAIADLSVIEDVAFSFEIPADTFSDQDTGEVLDYLATLSDGSSLPSWLSFDAGTRIFSGTPLNSEVGTISIKVTATDAAGEFVSDTFDIVIANTNDVPMIVNEIGDQAAIEDDGFSFQIPVGAFIDVDEGDVLAYSATLADGSELPAWLTFSPSTGTFHGTPGNDGVGTIPILVTATDRAGTSVSDAFELSVANVNDAPMLAVAIADQVARVGTPFELRISTNSFFDVDAGDSLTYSAVLASGATLPTWLKYDASTRTFRGTPAAFDVGTISVKVTATDKAGAGASDVFDLIVEAANSAIYGTVGNDTLKGTDAAETIFGLDGNDSLFGNAGNDTLDGGAGRDTMAGGTGDDIYLVDLAADVIVELDGEGTDTVRSSVTFMLGVNVENLELTGVVSISGFGNNSNNVLIGNGGNNMLSGFGGNDTLIGGAGDFLDGGMGDDIYIVDSTQVFMSESLGNGADSIRSSVSWDVGVGFEALFLTGTANIRGSNAAAISSVLLVGNSGANSFQSFKANDIVQGMDGDDVIEDFLSSGSEVMDGGIGNDSLIGRGAVNELFIGGKGNDVIQTYGGVDIIAFNKGDGQDIVKSGASSSGVGKKGDAPGLPNPAVASDINNVLSLGGGISYGSLTFSRSGNDLVLGAGGSDQISFADWYAATGVKDVSKLQIIVESTSEYGPYGDDLLPARKVEQFDFKALINAFDAGGQVNKWALSNALLSAHLSGSDTSAIGGDLAYQYGVSGSLAGIGLASAQEVVKSAQFGTAAQSLHTLAELQQGPIRLS